MVDKLQGAGVEWWNTPIPIYAKLHRATTLPDSSIQPVSGIRVQNDGARVCQVFCVSFLEKILWGGEPPRL